MWRRVVHGVLAVLIAGVLAADLYVLSQRSVTTAVTLDEALVGFRAGTTTSTTTSAAPTAAPGAGGAGVVRPTGGGASAPASGAGPMPVAAPVGAPAPPAPEVADAAPDRRPAAGVYRYRTSGGESISVAGASHRYPDETYAVVRHGEGCGWEARNEVVEEHVDVRQLCTGAGELLQLSQRREVEFFGARDGATLTCTPAHVLHGAADVPGATFLSSCEGDGSRARMQGTYVGREPIAVGGEVVDAVRVTLDAELSGRTTGSSRDELWLHPDSGLTLRWDRTVDTLADAAFGARVRYREDASFVLVSLAPAT